MSGQLRQQDHLSIRHCIIRRPDWEQGVIRIQYWLEIEWLKSILSGENNVKQGNKTI